MGAATDTPCARIERHILNQKTLAVSSATAPINARRQEEENRTLERGEIAAAEHRVISAASDKPEFKLEVPK